MSNLSRLREKILHLSRYNFLLSAEVKKIREAEKLDKNELLLRKERAVTSTVNHAVSHSVFYKKFYNGVNTGQPFDAMYQSLPLLRKQDVRENTEKILTGSARFLKKAYTSGTSGSPLAMYRSPGSILKENAYVWYYRSVCGLNPGEPVVSMRGTLDNTRLSYFNKSENTLYLSSYLLSKKHVQQYGELLSQFRPKAILAFPSSLFHLVNLLEEANIRMNIPLVFTSSETLYPFQRDKIEQFFNGRVFDWYGNAERTLALGQCEYGHYHELPMYSHAQFLPSGEVVTTSLINKAFPLIKYYVDDTFTLMDTACACGRGTGVKSIEGRVDDVLVLEDGNRISRLGFAFQGVSNLKYAQIIQEDLRSVTVNLVPGPEFSDRDQNLILEKMKKRLNDSLAIHFNHVEEKDIIKSPSGKFKLIISKLKHN